MIRPIYTTPTLSNKLENQYKICTKKKINTKFWPNKLIIMIL